MKTPVLFLSAALAIGTVVACSSSDAPSNDTTPGYQSVAQGGACSDTSQCQSPLTCLFPRQDKCSAKGVCGSATACTTETICPCGGGAAVTTCVDALYAPMPITGDSSCAGASDTDAGSSTPPTPPSGTDSGSSQPTPPTGDDSGAPADDAGTTDQDSGSGPVDSGVDTGSTPPPPVDAGHDSGSTGGHDAGSGADAGCPGFAAPGTPSTCNACATNGKTCDVNGCYGGYFCNTSTNKCVSKTTC